MNAINIDRYPVSSLQPAWPPCGWRVESDSGANKICEHVRVRVPKHRVTLAICESCAYRGSRDSSAPSRIDIQTGVCCGPSPARKVWNVTKAVGAFLADGVRMVDETQYRARLSICDSCDRRHHNHCRECGCRITLKARGRVFDCPLKKWPIIEQE